VHDLEFDSQYHKIKAKQTIPEKHSRSDIILVSKLKLNSLGIKLSNKEQRILGSRELWHIVCKLCGKSSNMLFLKPTTFTSVLDMTVKWSSG
jgi:hypothetical protein